MVAAGSFVVQCHVQRCNSLYLGMGASLLYSYFLSVSYRQGTEEARQASNFSSDSNEYLPPMRFMRE